MIGSISPGKKADLIMVKTDAWNMGMFVRPSDCGSGQS
jgi:imidazolonepropionase-like amidohydrolase